MIALPLRRLPQAYTPHLAYAAPAAHRPQLGRLILGIFLVEVLYAVALYVFDAQMGRFAPDFLNSVIYGDTTIGLIVQLTAFGFLGLSVVAAARLLQDRDILSLTGPLQPATRQTIAAFTGSILVFAVLQILPPWDDFRSAEQLRNPLVWVIALPFGMAALLVQTASEELLYRGYIQQQLAVRFRNPLIWIIVPNILFASAHWGNGGTSVESWQYVVWAFFFGLAATDLTARSGTLGPAVGMHLANNVYAFMFFGDAGGLDSGLALFLVPEYVPLAPLDAGPDPVISLSLIIELGILGLTWLGARVALRR